MDKDIDKRTLFGDRSLFFESPECSAEGATFTATLDGKLTICVSDESAVDSYNKIFDSYAELSREEAIILRNWLNKEF